MHAELLRTDRWEGEPEKRKAEGTRVVVSSRWSLVRDEQERPVAVLATNNDITERKRTEGAIRQLNAELAKRTPELEAMNKELEAFAYSISHDLRAHLRHMVWYTEPSFTALGRAKSSSRCTCLTRTSCRTWRENAGAGLLLRLTSAGRYSGPPRTPAPYPGYPAPRPGTRRPAQ